MPGAEVALNIVEIRKPEIDATLVPRTSPTARAPQWPSRRAMKRAVQSAMRLGAAASATTVPAASAAPRSPAWNGTAEGRVPLHTFARTSISARRRRRKDHLTAPAL